MAEYNQVNESFWALLVLILVLVLLYALFVPLTQQTSCCVSSHVNHWQSAPPLSGVGSPLLVANYFYYDYCHYYCLTITIYNAPYPYLPSPFHSHAVLLLYNCAVGPSSDNHDVIGVVGVEFSSFATATCQITGPARIPVVSFDATSDALSDKSSYSYFLRVVPPDRWVHAHMVSWLTCFCDAMLHWEVTVQKHPKITNSVWKVNRCAWCSKSYWERKSVSMWGGKADCFGFVSLVWACLKTSKFECQRNSFGESGSSGCSFQGCQRLIVGCRQQTFRGG